MRKWLIIALLPVLAFNKKGEPAAWIRINQLGYTPGGVKVAVWCGKEQMTVDRWKLTDAKTNKVVMSGNAGRLFGAYGPFKQTCRLNFSAFNKPGRYYLQAGETRSPEFDIGDNVYKGAADFCLRYMRQQRSGFNPFLKDSCHTHDGYVLYGEKAGIPDSTHIDVVGGWHDASDYLQYSSTSANATYHLLMAYRDFPKIFADEKQANGLDGKNGMADVLDEAKWGLDWLLKMHPKDDWMFNQVGDDRDHQGMRIPKEDSFYGRGYERPVYFVSGEPQQRGKFMNNTTGTSSTAGKFSSAFSLGFLIFKNFNTPYATDLLHKANTAFLFGLKKQGVSQTASVRSPYIYAEDNWVDDMELASIQLHNSLFKDEWNILNPDEFSENELLEKAVNFAQREPVTPWFGKDTAKHYEWYPFINLGHYEVAKYSFYRKKSIEYYKHGIELVWNKARQNAFYRGVPFIWCSNNLTTSFAIQCYWYRELTKDKTFSELEQANFDWLFGCNPWGTSMVYGLPSRGDTPVDPHSAFTHLKNYPIDGGLVDGPVYGSIYKSLIGIQLKDADEYSAFQSDMAVYHDDYGDYSTNEPTMDGTASLIYLLAAKEEDASPSKSKLSGSSKTPSPSERGSGVRSYSHGQSLKSKLSGSSKAPSLSERGLGVRSYSNGSGVRSHGAIIRGDSTKKQLALVFTGHEFADGGDFIARTLKQQKIKASFFFTGDFYYEPKREKLINILRKDGHFLGNHSGHHLLYCDWNKRDSLLVSQAEFDEDLFGPHERLAHLAEDARGPGHDASFNDYFLPPYEWYNDTIAAWTKLRNIQLINFTPGTLSNADYTTPEMKNYRSSGTIYHSIINYERTRASGLNGFILLLHIGTDPKRTDKFYKRLPELIKYLKARAYHFQTVDNLLKIK